MGNRRLSRKRLFQVEKAGKAIDLESGPGIVNAIASSTQHRNGQEIITEILIDLGTSKGTVIGNGSADKAIGEASKVAFITQLTVAKFGVITEIRAVCLEAPTTGTTSVSLDHSTSSTTATGADPAGTEICAGLEDVGEDITAEFDTTVTLGQNGTAHYLYLITNNSAGAASQFGTGKFAIYIHGFEVPADL